VVKLSFDFRAFRDQADSMKENIKQRNATGDVDAILRLSTQRSKLTVDSEKLRKSRNEVTDKLTREAKSLPSDTKKAMQDQARELRVCLNHLYHTINSPDGLFRKILQQWRPNCKKLKTSCLQLPKCSPTGAIQRYVYLVWHSSE